MRLCLKKVGVRDIQSVDGDVKKEPPAQSLAIEALLSKLKH